MATILKAGNVASGAQITSDATGILEIRTGTGAGTTAITVGTDQNVNFSGTAQRITGDFSNATVANRVMFQTSTANGNTSIHALPNGTSTESSFRAFNGTDPNNASLGGVICNASDVMVQATRTGTGAFLPMTFYTGGTETARFSATAKTLILSGGDTTANGTGITFPATQSASSNANTLDDYEEGTFTATFGGQTNVGSVSQNRYSYVKVGRTVTVFANFAFTPTASNALVYWFFSLPFAAEFNNNNSSGCVENNNGRTGSVSTFGSSTGNGYVLFPTTSQLSTAANSVYISFTYMAAS